MQVWCAIACAVQNRAEAGAAAAPTYSQVVAPGDNMKEATDEPSPPPTQIPTFAPSPVPRASTAKTGTTSPTVATTTTTTTTLATPHPSYQRTHSPSSTPYPTFGG